MSKDKMYTIISEMHSKLNKLIEINNYDLQSDQVQNYSKKLDKVLSIYNKS